MLAVLEIEAGNVPNVTLTRVSCTFRTRGGVIHALRDLDLSVGDGELMVLVGPSGCGKTTTLRVIAGLQAPSRGEIRIGERIVNQVAPRDRDVAMVFQNHALYPHMTVFKNLAFGLKMRGTPGDEIRRKVGQAAATLGIAHLLDRRPGSLSGGERQRVALGRAVVRKPQVFLFDEPLSSLDPGQRLSMRGQLKALHRELGTTTIHVTHDQEEAMTLGDRIAVMNAGILHQVGDPLEVYRKPADRFVACFIGSPPMNMFTGILRGGAGDTTFEGPIGRIGLGRLAPAPPPGPVVLGIRPQHITIGGGAAGLISAPAGEAVVRDIEPLGDVANVQLATPTGITFLARTPRPYEGTLGDRVGFSFDPTHVHLFAADSDGRRLN